MRGGGAVEQETLGPSFGCERCGLHVSSRVEHYEIPAPRALPDTDFHDLAGNLTESSMSRRDLNGPPNAWKSFQNDSPSFLVAKNNVLHGF